MTHSIRGQKAAILVSAGFDEKDMTCCQRFLAQAQAYARVISADAGLVTGWAGDNWGHHYAVDSQLNVALGVDYDVLMIPGGERSLAKLGLTAHTKRFIGSFLAAGKPVAVFGGALSLLINSGLIAGRKVTGPEFLKGRAAAAGAIWSEDAICSDGGLVTADVERADREAVMEALIDQFGDSMQLEEAA